MQDGSRLIFVYNAHSGALSGLKDSLQKWLRPKTYDCNLCAITYNSIGEKKSWRHFRKSFPIAMEFYHKNEFNAKFRSKWLPKYEFPMVLLAQKESLEPFIDSQVLNTLTTPRQLQQQIIETAKVFELI